MTLRDFLRQTAGLYGSCSTRRTSEASSTSRSVLVQLLNQVVKQPVSRISTVALVEVSEALRPRGKFISEPEDKQTPLGLFNDSGGVG